jgi:fatty acid desaturase
MNTMVTALPARRAHHPTNGDPHIRVGDREREKVITSLGQAFTQGYLSIPEYETRLSQALEAQTAGALNQVLSDLPVTRIARGDPRRRAARVAAARRSVQIHLAAYLAASLLMIGIWLALAVTVGDWYFWPIWPILGGGIGVISHAVPVRSCARSRRDPLPGATA